MKNKNISHYFHRLSNEYREQDKLFLAEILGHIAIFFYKINREFFGLSDVYQSLVLVYKHKYLLSKKQKFLKLSTKYAQKSFDLSLNKKLNNLYTCYFRLGEIDMLKNKFPSAVQNFQEAINLYPVSNSEKGNYQQHLGEALYQNNQKEIGFKTILIGLETIQKYRDKTDQFLVNIWESGCLLKLAAILYKDNQIQSQKYLSQADKIISNDPRLVIRKRQLIELKNKLNYGQK